MKYLKLTLPEPLLRWTRNYGFIVLTCLLALIAEIFYLPVWLAILRPHFVLLTLIYWILKSDYKIGLWTAFGVGLVLDILSGSFLGEHAFVFTLIAYFIVRHKNQIRIFPLIQQLMVIAAASVIYLAFIFWIQAAIAQAPKMGWMTLSVLSDVLLWNWFFARLSRARPKIDWMR